MEYWQGKCLPSLRTEVHLIGLQQTHQLSGSRFPVRSCLCETHGAGIGCKGDSPRAGRFRGLRGFARAECPSQSGFGGPGGPAGCGRPSFRRSASRPCGHWKHWSRRAQKPLKKRLAAAALESAAFLHHECGTRGVRPSLCIRHNNCGSMLRSMLGISLCLTPRMLLQLGSGGQTPSLKVQRVLHMILFYLLMRPKWHWTRTRRISTELMAQFWWIQ